MLNKLSVVFAIIVILLISTLVAYNYYVRNSNSKEENKITSPTIIPTRPISPQTTIAEKGVCTQQQLKASLTLLPAAGTIHAEFTLQNTSDKKCTLSKNAEIVINGVEEIENITVEKEQNSDIPLAAGAKATATATYPNGPQCTQVNPLDISFAYKAQNEVIKFTLPGGENEVNLQACKSEEEITEIQISNFKSP